MKREHLGKAYRLEGGSVIVFAKEHLSISKRVSFYLCDTFHHGTVLGSFDAPPMQEVTEKNCHLVSVTPNIAGDISDRKIKGGFPLPLMSNKGMSVHIFAGQIESYGGICDEPEYEGVANSFIITRSGRKYIVADDFETIMYYMKAYGLGMSLGEAMRYVIDRRKRSIDYAKALAEERQRPLMKSQNWNPKMSSSN